MSTTQQTNKDIIRQMNDEVWSSGIFDLIEEYIAPEYVEYNTASPQEIRGPAGYRENVEMIRHAFPDIEVEAKHLIEEGDRVMYHYRIKGTHEGELMGIDPTGQEVDFGGMGIARFEDGKVIEGWSVPDAFGLMAQLGVVESPAEED